MNLLSIQYGLAFQGFQAGGILTGMDPKEISAFLAPPKMTVWEHLLAFIGAAIGLLLIAAGTSLYKHDYHCGVGCFLAALVLGFAFFRKRKLALVITSLSTILALCSLGFPFHPSFTGFVLLLGCAASTPFHGALVL